MEAVFLEGKSSEFFLIQQAVVQGCTSSPTWFLIYINGAVFILMDTRTKIPGLPTTCS